MVFTKVPEADLAGGGSGAFPFLLIRTVLWSMAGQSRGQVRQDKES